MWQRRYRVRPRADWPTRPSTSRYGSKLRCVTLSSECHFPAFAAVDISGGKWPGIVGMDAASIVGEISVRSLIILEVEHGENTDVLEALINGAKMDAKSMDAPGTECKITNYTVRVDLPECFTLD